MTTPLVSIIIPTFNRVHLIGETLDSVLAQSYTNWECIVVDDGSSDGTEELLKSYVAQDNRFQYHKRPDSHLPGGNGARNYGLIVSKGDFINWFDSDDLMLKEKLKFQVQLLHHTSYDYTICQSVMCDLNTNKEIGLRAEKIISNRIFEDYIIFKIFWLTQAPLWKRSFLEKNNFRFNEDLKQSQDYDFHIRVLAVSENYSFTEKPLVKVRCHSGNMSNSMVEDVDKLKSNLFVKNEIYKNYNHLISLNTKRTVFIHLFEIYKQTVYSRSLIRIGVTFPYLLKHMMKIELSLLERFHLFVKITLVPLLYFLFKKGYEHLKISM